MRAPAVFWALLILAFSVMPAETTSAPPGYSAPGHFTAYLVLCLLLAVWPMEGRKAFVVTFAYGLLMELLQIPVPGRYFELQDIGLNALGAGSALAALYAKRASEASWLSRFKSWEGTARKQP